MSSSCNVYEMDPSVYAQLLALPGNAICVDCGEKNPDWGSPKLGILFCFQCSGKHRGLGTHISFVRSVTMDAWTEKQLKLMNAGGNKSLNDFLQKHGIDPTALTREKYDSTAAQLYQQVLLARIEGKSEPTTLPARQNSTASSDRPKKMEGFGSSPPPPQTSSRNKKVRQAFQVGIPVAAAGVAAAVWFLKP